GERFGGRGVVIAHRMVQTPDHRQLVHDPRAQRHMLRYLYTRNRGRDWSEDAADLRRRVWLWVPGIQLARPAIEEDKDARPDARARLGRADGSRGGLDLQQSGEGQPKTSETSDPQQMAAAHAVLWKFWRVSLRCHPDYLRERCRRPARQT